MTETFKRRRSHCVLIFISWFEKIDRARRKQKNALFIIPCEKTSNELFAVRKLPAMRLGIASHATVSVQINGCENVFLSLLELQWVKLSDESMYRL
jgi:hypothetical protein